ncbi:hypothetical protein VUR80DRAFT_3894 [Thermomyces stellatus]
MSPVCNYRKLSLYQSAHFVHSASRPRACALQTVAIVSTGKIPMEAAAVSIQSAVRGCPPGVEPRSSAADLVPQHPSEELTCGNGRYWSQARRGNLQVGSPRSSNRIPPSRTSAANSVLWAMCAGDGRLLGTADTTPNSSVSIGSTGRVRLQTGRWLELSLSVDQPHLQVFTRHSPVSLLAACPGQPTAGLGVSSLSVSRTPSRP